MSFDLEALKRISVSDSKNYQGLSDLPNWVTFMLWAGWEMRINNNGARQIMVMLLPERHCCSAFCSLGAVMAGSTLPAGSVTWNEVENLNEGETVFLLVEHRGKLKPAKGIVGGFHENVRGRWLQLSSTNNAIDGSSLLVLKENTEKLKLSFTPHASQIKLGKLKKVSDFFGQIVRGYDESWIVSNNIESVVVTQKAEWHRHIENLFLASSIKNKKTENMKIELSKLLMLTDGEESPSSHTRIVSFQSNESIGNPPLIILDGVEALSMWESCNRGNMIILMSRSEYNETAQNLISMLSSYRDETLLMEFENDPEDLIPINSEISIFALPGMQV